MSPLPRIRYRIPVVRASVTTWQVFFDLIFVFALGRLADLVLGSPTPRGYLDAAVVLVLTWALYDAYARLTDDPETVGWAVRIALLLGVVGFVIMAVAGPDAFGAARWPFAVAHLLVVLVYAGSSLAADRDGDAASWIPRRHHLGAAALVLLAVALPAGWRVGAGVAAVVVLGLGLATAGVPREPTPTEHRADRLAERHQLLMMIALAGTVLAVAAGSVGRTDDPVVVVALVCAVGLVTSLWWLYFGGASTLEARGDAEARPLLSARQLVVTHTATYLLYLAGLVLLTAGLRAMVAAPLSRLGPRLALTMATGTVAFLVAAAVYERRLRLGNGIGLLLTAVVLLPTALPGALVSGLSQLALLLGVVLVHIGLRRVADNPGGVDGPVSG